MKHPDIDEVADEAMSAAPEDLLDALAGLGPEPHAAVREETFDMSSAHPGPPMVLIRCKCGGLYGRTAIRRHINDPAGSWQRLPARYRALVRSEE